MKEIFLTDPPNNEQQLERLRDLLEPLNDDRQHAHARQQVVKSLESMPGVNIVGNRKNPHTEIEMPRPSHRVNYFYQADIAEKRTAVRQRFGFADDELVAGLFSIKDIKKAGDMMNQLSTENTDAKIRWICVPRDISLRTRDRYSESFNQVTGGTGVIVDKAGNGPLTDISSADKMPPILLLSKGELATVAYGCDVAYYDALHNVSEPLRAGVPTQVCVDNGRSANNLAYTHPAGFYKDVLLQPPYSLQKYLTASSEERAEEIKHVRNEVTRDMCELQIGQETLYIRLSLADLHALAQKT